VDPTTGARLLPINVATDWGWRTGGSTDNPGGAAGYYTTFSNWSGGVDWSNPADLLKNADSKASTNNTHPVDLYGIYTRFMLDHADNPLGSATYDDLGLVLWGAASDLSDSNNVISACIFLNPLDGCIGKPLVIPLPSTFTQLDSGGSDPDHVFPPSFPSPFFRGWGLMAPLGPDYVNTQGTLQAVNGAASLSSANVYSFFQPTLKAGNKIWVKGSAAQGCPNELCTVAVYQGSYKLILAENVTVPPGTPYIAYSWGVRIWKVTSTGTVTLGAAYKQAGSVTPPQIGAATPQINSHSFISGDGHSGYLVSIPSGGAGFLYFVSGDGTVRPLWAGHKSPNTSCYTPNNPDDLPEGLGFQVGPPFAFDPVNAKTFYVTHQTKSGETGIWRLDYTGDASRPANSNFAFSQAGDQFTMFPPCDNLHWTNLMAGHYLTAQASHWPGYSTTLYGNGWSFTGISGHYGYFVNPYSGQDGGPGWIAIVDLADGKLANMIHTADGTGTAGRISWGALHSALPAYPPNTVGITTNLLARSESFRLYGGPFQARILAVLRGGSWKTDTSLPWPMDDTYDGQCPAGNPFEFMGAVGRNCVTLMLPKGGVCNAQPRKDETPSCFWDTNYSQPLPVKVGDVFTDIGIYSDGEHFRIVALKTNTDNTVTLVAQRNAMWDYCCVGPSVHGGVDNCLDSPEQNRHANGWTILMNPAYLNGCSSGVFHYDPTTGQVGEAGRFLIGGHSAIGPGLSASTMSLVAISANGAYGVRFNKTFSELYSLPTTFFRLASPTFSAFGLPIGAGVQTYPEVGGRFMWDINTINNNFGNTNLAQRVLTATDVPGVYKIQVIGNVSPKLMPLFGWAGRYLLRDISGPTSSVDGTPWSMCYALLAGECHTASTAGDTYVNIPGTSEDGNCFTGQYAFTTPCVVTGWPSAGGIRQQAVDGDDTAGVRGRLLSYGLTAPGEHVPYTGIALSPDGTFAILSAQLVQGWGNVAFLVKAPSWEEPSGPPRNQFVGVPVEIPPGPGFAEVQFGYSRFGNPQRFQCTARADSCNTSGTPFNFESEPRTDLKECPSGCTLSIPAIAGNILYYRVRRSADGLHWRPINGDIQVRAIP
jgi:hypothetical protein